MSYSFSKARFAASVCEKLDSAASAEGKGTDGMRLLLLLSGVFTEIFLLFDDPDEGVEATCVRLEEMLGCKAFGGAVGSEALPPPYVTDYETERGRAIARGLFEEWLQCPHEFHDLMLFVTQHTVLRLETEGQQRREETLRLFRECLVCALSYELAAQELCDIVIDRKVMRDGWSLGESVSGLSALAGRCLALSQDGRTGRMDGLDQVAYVMTQEAVRLGIPAGTDWRFGLAANDHPASAPLDLIYALEPPCRDLFRVLGLHGLLEQAVVLAKAAGRMLAIAAGGENPEIEPVIAKPLAMAAITETYRTVYYGGAAMPGYVL